MKKTTAALLAVLCALLSGCSLDGGSDKKPISVPYSAMFGQKSSPETETETVAKQANAQKQAEASPETATAAPESDFAAPAEASAQPSAATASASTESKPVSSAEKAAAAPAPRAGETESNTSGSNSGAETSKTESEPRLVLVTPTKLPEKNDVSAVNKDIASTPLGGVVYLSYKADEPEETSEPSTTTSGESGSESESKPAKKKEKTKYDYGYRVVFRTSSETYLMGVTPYKSCKWDDIAKVCKEIEEKLETECEIVGAPSLEDLKMFTESGICFPEKCELWTSTKTAEKGFKAYYRNSKGTFYSTKSTSQTCGVSVIIKVKTSQSNNELLSSSWENFNELKTQLEKEAADYKAAANKTNNNG